MHVMPYATRNKFGVDASNITTAVTHWFTYSSYTSNQNTMTDDALNQIKTILFKLDCSDIALS